ncbi:hypothetical protein [Phenylobacterium sp.]|uniref:hypothetical protein n=1 Tax=Phenylobacterium sp. TaxID=1871053 RepID=UPI00301B8F17
MLKPLAIATLLSLAASGAAQADVCRGQAPSAGLEMRGPVLHVLDGQRLCVALSPDPADWVAVRLADAPPVETVEAVGETGRGALMAASFGQDVTCRILGEGEDGAVALCRTNRGPVGEQLSKPRIIRAGQAWR